jgi:hypothetical protein
MGQQELLATVRNLKELMAMKAELAGDIASGAVPSAASGRT